MWLSQGTLPILKSDWALSLPRAWDMARWKPRNEGHWVKKTAKAESAISSME